MRSQRVDCSQFRVVHQDKACESFIDSWKKKPVHVELNNTQLKTSDIINQLSLYMVTNVT